MVSIAKLEDENIEKAVYKSIDLLGGLEEIKDKRSVSIKPNLCCLNSSSSGATTDPRIVEAIIKKIRTISSCKINIVESNTSHASADKSFRTLGYTSLQEKYSGVKCVNLSKDSKIRLSLNGKIFSTILMPETMFFSDYIINVAKLKTHVDHRYTGVLKNAYGFLLSRNRAQYHGFMERVLVDLNRIYKPNLSIIDAVIGMEGFGPVNGTPKRVGVIIASKDPVAADAVGAQIMGIKPSSIKYLKCAEKQGIGGMREIVILGSNLQDISTGFDFIPLRWYYLGRVSLWLQRVSRYVSNFAVFLRLARSALSVIGFSELKERSSILGLTRLAKETVFKIDA